jgi:hypothetical protein
VITCTALAIGVSIASYHFDRDIPYQEINPGVYAICDKWTAGVYRNSFNDLSVFAGYSLELGPFSIALGVVTGYGRYGKSVQPLIFPSVKIGSVRLGVIPPPEPKAKGALTLSVEW